VDCTDSEETTPRGESKSGGLSLKRGAAIFSGASRQAKSPAKGGNEDEKGAKTEKERKKERKTLKKEKKAAASAGGDQAGGHGGAALNNLKIGFSKTIMTVRKRKKKRSILVPPSIFIMPPGRIVLTSGLFIFGTRSLRPATAMRH
jgi:hypothetical protein